MGRGKNHQRDGEADSRAAASEPEAEFVLARLERTLTHLKAAESSLMDLSRERIASLDQAVTSAEQELRAARDVARAAASCRLPAERLQGRLRELVLLSHRVQRLFDGARNFYRTLLTMQETEQHGYGGLIAAPGTPGRMKFPHRLEVRG